MGDLCGMPEVVVRLGSYAVRVMRVMTLSCQVANG